MQPFSERELHDDARWWDHLEPRVREIENFSYPGRGHSRRLIPPRPAAP